VNQIGHPYQGSNDFPIARIRYEGVYLHVVSGTSGDHLAQSIRLEGLVPVRRQLRLGLAFVRASVTVGDQTTASKPKGLGVRDGAGWMCGRERRVSFAPFSGHDVASLGDVPTPAGPAENPVSNVWFAGVTVFIR
jgi:hypothetical protein